MPGRPRARGLATAVGLSCSLTNTTSAPLLSPALLLRADEVIE
jgi:hypothetical protein